jgi:DNA-directed RNA polymerase alpha subunit
MKIHMDFNSLAEMLNYARTLSNGFGQTASVPPMKDKDLPVGVSDWKEAYQRTYLNLERAYERIREFEHLKETNKIIAAEVKKAEKKKAQELEKDFIDNLNLSARAVNCLKCENVYTISALLEKSADDLIKSPNLGKITLKEIREELANHDLKLKGE